MRIALMATAGAALVAASSLLYPRASAGEPPPSGVPKAVALEKIADLPFFRGLTGTYVVTDQLNPKLKRTATCRPTLNGCGFLIECQWGEGESALHWLALLRLRPTEVRKQPADRVEMRWFEDLGGLGGGTEGGGNYSDTGLRVTIPAPWKGTFHGFTVLALERVGDGYAMNIEWEDSGTKQAERWTRVK